MIRAFSTALVVLVAACCGTAFADNIAECGDSDGEAMFLADGLLANNHDDTDRWRIDRVSAGKIVLTEGDDGSLDLLWMDARGSINSASKNGAQVVLVGRSKQAISVAVSRPNVSIETYTFFRRNDGTKEVLWTATKYGAPINLVRAMHASCSTMDIGNTAK